MSLKEVTKVIHFIVCLYRLLSSKLLISDDKDAFLLFSWHGEGTFHMKDLFPAFMGTKEVRMIILNHLVLK